MGTIVLVMSREISVEHPSVRLASLAHSPITPGIRDRHLAKSQSCARDMSTLGIAFLFSQITRFSELRLFCITSVNLLCSYLLSLEVYFLL